MKQLINKLILATGIIFLISSCHKVADLPYYNNGEAVALTASKTTIAVTAADSANNVVDFTWTSPKYATDTSTYKFVIEIDSANRNFSKKVTRTVSGSRSTSFTGKQLNTILADLGFATNQQYGLDVRVTSSYANNNEQLKSNTVKIIITPYLVPITLVPSSTAPVVLQVSNASNTAISFNWNASPYGSGVIKYAIQFDTAGGTFANPQTRKVQTAYTTSFTVSDLNSMAIAAGVIGGSTKNLVFRVVSYSGDYVAPLAYSNNVPISVTTFTPVPSTLYIVGDATAGGWNNPVPVPSQQFSRINAVSYGIVINLTAGKSYLFLPLNGDWNHKYGGSSATGGALLADGAVPGSNTPAPATSGLYKIIVNFQTGTYTVTPLTAFVPVPDNLYIVGDATAGGWANPVPVPSQQFARVNLTQYQINIHLTNPGSYLFLPLNGDWGHKFGGSSATGGTLLADGAVPGSNTPAPAAAGDYKIVVDFETNNYSVTHL